MPVRDVEQGGQQVAPRSSLGEQVTSKVHDHGDDHEDDQQGWQEASDPPRPEGWQVDPARPRMLREEEGRNEVAAQDEEQVHAEVAARQPGPVQVVGEDAQDGQRAEPVKEGAVVRSALVGNSSGRSLGWRRRRDRRPSPLVRRDHRPDYAVHRGDDPDRRSRRTGMSDAPVRLIPGSLGDPCADSR